MQREEVRRQNGSNVENTGKPCSLASCLHSCRQVKACYHSEKTLVNSANDLGTHHRKSPFFLASGRVGLLTPAGTDTMAEGP